MISRAARFLLPSLLLAACGERIVYLPCDASAGEPLLDASTRDAADAVGSASHAERSVRTVALGGAS